MNSTSSPINANTKAVASGTTPIAALPSLGKSQTYKASSATAIQLPGKANRLVAQATITRATNSVAIATTPVGSSHVAHDSAEIAAGGPHPAVPITVGNEFKSTSAIAVWGHRG